ncbi:MAG: DedA family protein [Acidobacteria bacterium]|nr:MAG: DedA family protein [Acidobacteriota bacterium]
MLLVLQDGILGFIKSIVSFLYSFALALGGPGLFLIAVADSSFLSIPEGNDVLIVILSTGQTWKTMAYYATMTVMGSVTGCILLFTAGRRGGNFIRKRLSEKRTQDLENAYERWGVWSILVPSILPPPTPFKIFVLWAGMFGVPYRKFIVAVLLGRSVRYYMWGTLAVLYGESAKYFLEHNLRFVGIVLFVVLVAVVLTIILVRTRTKKTPRQEDLI